MAEDLTSCVTSKKKLSAGLYIVIILCSVFAGLFIWNYNTTTSKVFEVTFKFNDNFNIVKYDNFTTPGEMEIIEGLEFTPLFLSSYILHVNWDLYNDYKNAEIKNDTDYYESLDNQYSYKYEELIWMENLFMLEEMGVIDDVDEYDNNTINGLNGKSLSSIYGNPIFIGEINMYGLFINYTDNSSISTGLSFEIKEINEYLEILNNTITSDTVIEFMGVERIYDGTGLFDYEDIITIKVNDEILKIDASMSGP